jgi:putative toxin-antitoxin system antitoxin component (TIGR02293 family)
MAEERQQGRKSEKPAGKSVIEENGTAGEKRRTAAPKAKRDSVRAELKMATVGRLFETTAAQEESAVIAYAVKVIGDRSDAMRWMGTPIRDLDCATPVSLLGTRDGRQAVITVLGRLEHGVL